MTTSSRPWRDRDGVIVLAAYRPDPELFRIQLESIRDQTIANWRCLIGADGDRDEVGRLVAEVAGQDPRFEVVGWDDNVGFYLNFERLLDAVPSDVDWVALSDQDDRWYPDKLERLLPELERVALVSGQARLVTWPEGAVSRERTTRRTVTPPLLLLMNQVTGSLSVFRRDLLDVALPFPRLDTVTQLHDHWLAVCASVAGGYEVLDVVVQDYVQHCSNVVGEGARGIAAVRGAWERLGADAVRTEGGCSPVALARASATLTFGWRRLVRQTIGDRVGPSGGAALRVPHALGPEGSRRESMAITAVAVASRHVGLHTALTFVVALPAELARRRNGPLAQQPPRQGATRTNPDPGRAFRGAPIAVALVLYEVAPADSIALRSLTEYASEHRNRFRVFVYDNSKERGVAGNEPPGVGIDRYLWDPTNPGLAGHYQDALERAHHEGCAWLMLLDQDTEVTPEYLEEVLSAVQDPGLPPAVATIAPRLISGRRTFSPHGRTRIWARPVRRSGTYPASVRCEVWNSGRVLRVSAVRAAGGFPVDYPLDYLDHAVSARLRRSGAETLVLDAKLTHSSSLQHRGDISQVRQTSIAHGEERYYVEYGSSLDRTFLVTRRALTLALVVFTRLGSPSPREDAQALLRSVGLLVRPGLHRDAIAASRQSPRTDPDGISAAADRNTLAAD